MWVSTRGQSGHSKSEKGREHLLAPFYPANIYEAPVMCQALYLGTGNSKVQSDCLHGVYCEVQNVNILISDIGQYVSAGIETCTKGAVEQRRNN